MKRIYLIRHGQTTGDVEDRYGGDYDDHLTEEGQKQAQVLAGELFDKGIEMIFSSPRIRAQETSWILRDCLNCDIKVIDGLRERNTYGVLTGMVKAEAKERYPEQVERLKSYLNTLEGGEAYTDFKQRIVKAFLSVVGSEKGTIAVVTHGGPFRCLFREFFQWGELKELGDGAVAEIVKEADNFKLLNLAGAALADKV